MYRLLLLERKFCPSGPEIPGILRKHQKKCHGTKLLWTAFLVIHSKVSCMFSIRSGTRIQHAVLPHRYWLPSSSSSLSNKHIVALLCLYAEVVICILPYCAAGDGTGGGRMENYTHFLVLVWLKWIQGLLNWRFLSAKPFWMINKVSTATPGQGILCIKVFSDWVTGARIIPSWVAFSRPSFWSHSKHSQTHQTSGPRGPQQRLVIG